MTAQQIAAFIEHQRQATSTARRSLARLSGHDKSVTAHTLDGAQPRFNALADMLQVFGFALVIESTDDRLPLSLDQLRAAVGR